MNAPPAPSGEFEQLVDYLKQSRGFDFSGYKRPTLMRRVGKRMETVNVHDYSDYKDYLEVHPEEFTVLFDTILINVTSFFRDEPTWEYLRDKVLPQLVAQKKDDVPIRIWSAGCASGEEPYSIAMLMAEALGKEALHSKVKIYATDVDEQALAAARHAAYSDKSIEAVPAELRRKYFESVNGRRLLNQELRRAVIFGRHDLVQDAPMSHLDLLVCRNTLMYFNAETQARILGRFNYAIHPGGFLFLGKAEMLLYSPLYAPLDMKHRVFSKAAQINLRERPPIFGQIRGGQELELNRYGQLRDAVFETGRAAQIVIDEYGDLIMANELARRRYRIGQADIGRPFRDLEISYQPAELRSLIDQVYAERKGTTIVKEEAGTSDDGRTVSIELISLIDDGAIVGISITFADVSRLRKLELELDTVRTEAETANEELQTSNEELQSTNKELETTNEELQSTNEELETMNEEMQSANEELRTINDELHLRSEQLDQSNGLLQTILASLPGGVVVVDAEMKILLWSSGAEDMCGLRSDEVKGQRVFDLDVGLPFNKLRDPLQRCVAESREVQDLILDAINRRGRKIKCRVGIRPLGDGAGQTRGAIILIEEMGM